MRCERAGRVRKVLLMLLLLVLPTLNAGCGGGSESVTVFAAAGAKPAVDEACERFEERYGSGVEVSYGGGGEVLSRMISLRKGDVYIAPEQKFMEKAAQEGAVDPETVATVAYMVPVLGVQKGNPKHIAGLPDLARPGVRVAVTRPETTLLGKYAPEIFEKAGLADEIGKNIVTEAARPDLLVTWLSMGKVDAVITWHFYETLAPDELDVVPLAPEQLTGIGEMQVAVSSYTRDRGLAQGFVDFLLSAEGKAVFEKHGYIVDVEELQ
jgi:molybdate transport system substrate-binding protein